MHVIDNLVSCNWIFWGAWSTQMCKIEPRDKKAKYYQSDDRLYEEISTSAADNKKIPLFEREMISFDTKIDDVVALTHDFINRNLNMEIYEKAAQAKCDHAFDLLSLENDFERTLQNTQNPFHLPGNLQQMIDTLYSRFIACHVKVEIAQNRKDMSTMVDKMMSSGIDITLSSLQLVSSTALPPLAIAISVLRGVVLVGMEVHRFVDSVKTADERSRTLMNKFTLTRQLHRYIDAQAEIRRKIMDILSINEKLRPVVSASLLMAWENRNNQNFLGFASQKDAVQLTSDRITIDWSKIKGSKFKGAAKAIIAANRIRGKTQHGKILKMIKDPNEVKPKDLAIPGTAKFIEVAFEEANKLDTSDVLKSEKVVGAFKQAEKYKEDWPYRLTVMFMKIGYQYPLEVSANNLILSREIYNIKDGHFYNTGDCILIKTSKDCDGNCQIKKMHSIIQHKILKDIQNFPNKAVHSDHVAHCRFKDTHHHKFF